MGWFAVRQMANLPCAYDALWERRQLKATYVARARNAIARERNMQRRMQMQDACDRYIATLAHAHVNLEHLLREKLLLTQAHQRKRSRDETAISDDLRALLPHAFD
jgi:hypothetical protein